MRSAPRISSSVFFRQSFTYQSSRYQMTAATAPASTAVRSFNIDKTHSEIGFQVRHLLTKVRGRFTDFNGTIQFDQSNPERSSVAFAINASSIDTGVPDRDAHLRGDDFF